MSRLGSPQPFSLLSSSFFSSLLPPFFFLFFSCALYRGAQERLLQFPAVAAAAVARPGPWCATPCGAVLSGTVSRGRPFCHLGGWGWGARASENSSGYGCQDASWTEADPKRRKASPPPLLGQSCFDCLNDGKGASEGRGRSPTATMVGHIRSTRHGLLDSASHACLLKSFFVNSLQGIGKHRFGRPFPESVSRARFLKSAPRVSFFQSPALDLVSAASRVRLSITLFASTLSGSLLESAVWSPCRGIGRHHFANPLLPLWGALLASAFLFPLLESASRVHFLKPAIRVRSSHPLAPILPGHR